MINKNKNNKNKNNNGTWARVLLMLFFWRWLIADRVGRARGLDLRPHPGRAVREDDAGDEGGAWKAGLLNLAVGAGAEVGLVARACSHLDAPLVALIVRVDRARTT